MVTTTFEQESFLQETAELFLVIVEIDHADLSTPIRVVNDSEDVTSNGDLYVAFPFDVTLPDSTGDAPPTASLVIDNVSQEVAQAIRTVTSAPTCNISVIRKADPDTIEVTFPTFNLRDVKVKATTVAGQLQIDDLTREPYPAHQFTPADFPGLF